jgi:transposase-like protein
MYSYEDRIRAVELYIKLGKRVRPTIRQLGYPTKNALKGWHREYEQRLDLPVGYGSRKPKYSQAQKEAAVKHYLAHDRCIAATGRALGYPCRGTLAAWVPTSAGTTRRGSKSPLALSAPSNTERVLELRHKPVQEFVRTPGGSEFNRRRQERLWRVTRTVLKLGYFHGT